MKVSHAGILRIRKVFLHSEADKRDASPRSELKKDTGRPLCPFPGAFLLSLATSIFSPQVHPMGFICSLSIDW